MRLTGDFLFVDLRKKLNSLTSRFRQVSSRAVSRLNSSITIHDETKTRIIYLAKKKKKKKKKKDIFSEIISSL